MLNSNNVPDTAEFLSEDDPDHLQTFTPPCPDANKSLQSELNTARLPPFGPPLLTKPLWMRACVHHGTQNHLIFVMRSGERVDRIFSETWTRTEMKNGKVCSIDANFPQSVPAFKFSDLINDSPITEIGKFSCLQVSTAMRKRRIYIDRIVCSPALRAIESATVIARHLKINVQVEQGLREPDAWYSSRGEDEIPRYLTQDQLVRCKYPIVVDQSKPILEPNEGEAISQEDENQGFVRIYNALSNLFEQEREGPLLVVGHAITMNIAQKIAASSVALNELERANVPRDHANSRDVDFVKLGQRYPYSSVLTLYQTQFEEPFQYYILPPLLPPLNMVQGHKNNVDFRE
ncbi:histidine phosphatase superfamily (branch 1) domain-containing protein [Ditylenchus destructor]|uniref:Histidine phosphatase superfamily (Branch 1) domain-containing protein n=1 Tax=Ditylenchus destructor TaxID=166010 RepID=A0AAD4QWV2_9BILA|nr:histidine phosphatase superfamily (branch 1) domain-containing protein [Ditylenchus destructor]